MAPKESTPADKPALEDDVKKTKKQAKKHEDGAKKKTKKRVASKFCGFCGKRTGNSNTICEACFRRRFS